MDLSEALTFANSPVFPGMNVDEASQRAERLQNEEAIQLLRRAWWEAPRGKEPFEFSLVMELADRNRALCDQIGSEHLRNERGWSLARSLSERDLIRGVAKLQHRRVASVRKTAGAGAEDLAIAFTEAKCSGMVVGIDIETTDRFPDRGYIVNVGLQFMDIGPGAHPLTGYAAFCGLPSDPYATSGVPLSEIHGITWDDLKDRRPLREDSEMQQAILTTLKAYPYLAHNAAFEDSWFMLNIDGYAEARKADKITPIDTRDICRRIDPEVRTLPRESAPASLEHWARRRGTLAPDEKERHLGLEDVDLMLRTTVAELAERNML